MKDHNIKYVTMLLIGFLGFQELSAQFIPRETFPTSLKYRSSQSSNHFQSISRVGLYSTGLMDDSEVENGKTSLLAELGYISAMQLTFGGLSYLASRDNKYGLLIAGGADVFMGLAGFQNALHQEETLQMAGYVALSAGFIAKSLFNFGVFGEHSQKTRFRVNFVGYNILVFSGYVLDSL